MEIVVFAVAVVAVGYCGFLGIVMRFMAHSWATARMSGVIRLYRL